MDFRTDANFWDDADYERDLHIDWELQQRDIDDAQTLDPDLLADRYEKRLRHD